MQGGARPRPTDGHVRFVFHGGRRADWASVIGDVLFLFLFFVVGRLLDTPPLLSAHGLKPRELAATYGTLVGADVLVVLSLRARAKTVISGEAKQGSSLTGSPYTALITRTASVLLLAPLASADVHVPSMGA